MKGKRVFLQALKIIEKLFLIKYFEQTKFKGSLYNVSSRKAFNFKSGILILLLFSRLSLNPWYIRYFFSTKCTKELQMVDGTEHYNCCWWNWRCCNCKADYDLIIPLCSLFHSLFVSLITFLRRNSSKCNKWCKAQYEFRVATSNLHMRYRHCDAFLRR